MVSQVRVGGGFITTVELGKRNKNERRTWGMSEEESYGDMLKELFHPRLQGAANG